MPTAASRPRTLLKTLLWVLLAQFLLMNLSGALYAYKFTHFKEGAPPSSRPRNIFTKTWTLFSGPYFYRMPQGGLPSFAFTEAQLQTADGISMKGWYAAADSARGCVIFLHGYTANKSHLLDEAARLHHWGYNVLLIDFRSHGGSTGKVNTLGVEETAEALAAFTWVKERGNRRVIFYGSSLGSVVALRAVAEEGLRPDGLVLDMPFASLHDHLKARARLLGFPAQPFAFLVTAWIGWEQGFNGFAHNAVKYARKVDCPVLLQWGEEDPYVTRAETQSIFAALGTKEKRLALYPGAGHYSLLQADPIRWERELTLFLASN
jgi:alpha-beta hydrolase superfamily lysophospholipase